MLDVTAWTQAHAQEIRDHIYDLEELREMLDADSVEWVEDNEMPVMPTNDEPMTLREMLREMQEAHGELQASLQPKGLLGEILVLIQERTQMVAACSDWFGRSIPTVQAAVDGQPVPEDPRVAALQARVAELEAQAKPQE